VPKPSGIAGDAIGGPVSAISARDVWLYASTQNFTTNSADSNYALHWNRGRWTVFPFPKQTSIQDLIAFSDTNVWAFGQTDPSGPKQSPLAEGIIANYFDDCRRALVARHVGRGSHGQVGEHAWSEALRSRVVERAILEVRSRS
jgi:hypothetical protein